MNAISRAAKPWVRALSTYQPGKPIEELARELCLGDAGGIVKLASNENSLGPSPRALQAMSAAASRMHLYPDGDTFYLKAALAAKLGVKTSQVFFGHGSNEIIQLLGHIYLEDGSNIVAADGAFLIYRLVASLYRADTLAIPMRNYTHDLDAMAEAVTPRTKLVFIANPNNPTGTMVDGEALTRFMDRVPAHAAVVIDEAYIELIPRERQPDTLRYVREGRAVYILRTFSKTYGLAGLRIGYAIAPEAGVELLHKVRQPFNVNAMAQAAALAALEDDEYVERTRAMVQDGLRQVTQQLDSMGVAYVPSVANFLLVKVGRGLEICQALQRNKVIVRPMDPYGMPEHVRVTIGTRAENQTFLAALGKVMQEATTRR
jgi:histidinol-phosphate aminotransferase